MSKFVKVKSEEEAYQYLDAGLLWVNQSTDRVVKRRHSHAWMPADTCGMWWIRSQIKESFERRWSSKEPNQYRKDDFAILVED